MDALRLSLTGISKFCACSLKIPLWENSVEKNSSLKLCKIKNHYSRRPKERKNATSSSCTKSYSWSIKSTNRVHLKRTPNALHSVLRLELGLNGSFHALVKVGKKPQVPDHKTTGPARAECKPMTGDECLPVSIWSWFIPRKNGTQLGDRILCDTFLYNTSTSTFTTLPQFDLGILGLLCKCLQGFVMTTSIHSEHKVINGKNYNTNNIPLWQGGLRSMLNVLAQPYRSCCSCFTKQALIRAGGRRPGERLLQKNCTANVRSVAQWCEPRCSDGTHAQNSPPSSNLNLFDSVKRGGLVVLQ